MSDCDPVDCSLPSSSVHGILQERILKWVAIPFSRGFFPTQGLNLPLRYWSSIILGVPVNVFLDEINIQISR